MGELYEVLRSKAFGTIESISSMKMIAGEFFSASSKAFLKLLSLFPAILLVISGPLIKKNAPVSFDRASHERLTSLSGNRGDAGMTGRSL
jgi:hypothetical protein